MEPRIFPVTQLRLLLSLPAESPTFATPSFRPWLPADDDPVWPPPDTAAGGLWLVDTRDREARKTEAVWGNPGAGPVCDALLVLGDPEGTGGLISRFVRRLRSRRRPRIPPARVAARLAGTPPGWVTTELVHGAVSGLPTDFTIRADDAQPASAWLVTRTGPFSGDLWGRVARGLGAPVDRVLGFQLRTRGAAVVLLRAGGHEFVVRAVPPGPLQAVIRDNHTAIAALRTALRVDEFLLGLIPEPVFEDRTNEELLLGETRLPGTLAWKLARSPLGPVIHDEALRVLDALRAATLRSRPLRPSEVAAFVEQDRRRFHSASFLDDELRDAVDQELAHASGLLETAEFLPHASHGDFGYGNMLVDPQSGRVTGVIDWDTVRMVDFPGIDRVNMEIQIRRSVFSESFADAVRSVWELRAAQEALRGPDGERRERGLYGFAVCRYIERSLSYPAVFHREAPGFSNALAWLAERS